jgi:hypothetical protein
MSVCRSICPSAKDTSASFRKKITYAIRWECPVILKTQLAQTHLSINEKKEVSTTS